VNKNGYKIGFSEIGGIYVGKNVQSSFHKYYAITILLSLGAPFKITTENNEHDFYDVAIIQKNTSYNLQTSKDDYVVFIHIVPYSNCGVRLYNPDISIQKLKIDSFGEVLKEYKDWFCGAEKDTEKVEYLLEKTSLIPAKSNSKGMLIDDRIRNSFNLIMQSESEKLSINQIASAVHLSTSHFARLFKKETGMTFRKFVLHSKLVKSIYAIYEQNSLTEASFMGGFSDQPHFTRTFKGAFGISPSSSRK